MRNLFYYFLGLGIPGLVFAYYFVDFMHSVGL